MTFPELRSFVLEMYVSDTSDADPVGIFSQCRYFLLHCMKIAERPLQSLAYLFNELLNSVYNPKGNIDACIVRRTFHHRQMWWVRPVCLHHHHQSGEEELAGKPGVILGWGVPNLTLPTDNKLQETRVRVVSNKECARNYTKEDIPITRNMLCAKLEGAHVSLIFFGGHLIGMLLVNCCFVYCSPARGTRGVSY